MDRAIVRFGTLFSGVLFASVNGIEPVQATVSRSGKTISIAQGYLDGGGVYEHFTGNVNYPSWSPDGLTVALVASFDSINKTGFERVRGEWVLVLMNTETLSTTIVADGIYEPHIVKWTGDSRHLIYGAKRTSGVQGLWLFSLSRQSSSLIAKGRFPDFILGPTDQDVYAIRCIDTNAGCDEREVWRYELPESVK